MASTSFGTQYVSSSDYVANWPTVSQSIANSIDAKGNLLAYGVEITSTTSQTGIAANTWTKVAFASHTAVKNTGGYTISSGAITIPAGLGGVYMGSITIGWDTGSTGNGIVGIAQSTTLSTTLVANNAYGSSTQYRMTASGLFTLAAGDTVCGTCLNTAGTRTIDTTYQTQRLALIRISS